MRLTTVHSQAAHNAVPGITAVHRASAPREEDERLQRRQLASSECDCEVGSEIESELTNSRGQGQALPDTLRRFTEPRFGADFRDVRLHTDSRAARLNRLVGAQALTYGRDIYFGEGHEPSDVSLTAHALTHVPQQHD